MCLSASKEELCKAIVSQYRDDSVPSLYISEVQPSPKWHIDNNIHSGGTETKDEAFLIIDMQHIFTFPHFKMISPWSSTQCLQREDVPIKKTQAYLFVQEDLARKRIPPPFQLWVKPVTNFTFLNASKFWLLLLCFISHFIAQEGEETQTGFRLQTLNVHLIKLVWAVFTGPAL